MPCTARTMLLQDICPSVRPSVTRRHSIETAKHTITVFLPAGNHSNRVIPHRTVRQYSDGDLPLLKSMMDGWCQMRGIMKKPRFSANISLYIETDTRQSHSYYGTRIGNRTQACEWYHYQWLWMTPNPDFKITPLFDAEYLRNGTSNRHSYNGGTYTRPTQQRHFEWPWVNLSDVAKYLMSWSIARSLCDSCRVSHPLVLVIYVDIFF